ncbi:MAG TPA: hypothetical protein GXZ32_08640 [Clostridiales bacterium]|nr:hypothetical protein [Clostridiales bacterium]
MASVFPDARPWLLRMIPQRCNHKDMYSKITGTAMGIIGVYLIFKVTPHPYKKVVRIYTTIVTAKMPDGVEGPDLTVRPGLTYRQANPAYVFQFIGYKKTGNVFYYNPFNRQVETCAHTGV